MEKLNKFIKLREDNILDRTACCRQLLICLFTVLLASFVIIAITRPTREAY